MGPNGKLASAAAGIVSLSAASFVLPRMGDCESVSQSASSLRTPLTESDESTGRDIRLALDPAASFASHAQSNNLEEVSTSTELGAALSLRRIASPDPGWQRIPGTVLGRDDIAEIVSPDNRSMENSLRNLAIIRVIPVSPDHPRVGEIIAQAGSELWFIIDEDVLGSGSQLQLQIAFEDGRVVSLNPNASDSQSIIFRNRHFAHIDGVAVQVGHLDALRNSAQASSSFLESQNVPHLPMAQVGEQLLFSLLLDDSSVLNNETTLGKAVIFYDWASWCATCPQVKAELDKMLNERADEVIVVAFNHDFGQTAAIGQRMTSKLHPDMRSITLQSHDYGEGDIAHHWAVSRFGVNAMVFPFTLVIDRDGVVVSQIRGAQIDSLRAAVGEALRER